MRSIPARIAVLLSALIATAGIAATPKIPNQLLLQVRDTAGVARQNEVVRSGVPIPRALNLRTTELTALAIRSSLNERSPMSKTQGEYIARLHSAVTHLMPARSPRRRDARR